MAVAEDTPSVIDQIKTAREHGYDDSQIYDHLGSVDSRFADAQQAGYSLDQVAEHISQDQPDNQSVFNNRQVGAPIPQFSPDAEERQMQSDPLGYLWGKATNTLIPKSVRDAIENATTDENAANVLVDAGGPIGSIMQIAHKVMGDDAFKQVVGGVSRGVEHVAESFVSPLAIAAPAVGKLPVLGQKMLALAFAGSMAKQLPEQFQAIADAKTPSEKATKTTEALATALMSGLGFAHGVSRGSVSAADVTKRLQAREQGLQAGISGEGQSATIQPIAPESQIPAQSAPPEALSAEVRQASPEDTIAQLNAKIDSLMLRRIKDKTLTDDQRSSMWNEMEDLQRQIDAHQSPEATMAKIATEGPPPVPPLNPNLIPDFQTEPSTSHATPEIQQPTGLREQPESGASRGQAQETGTGDSLQRAAGSTEETPPEPLRPEEKKLKLGGQETGAINLGVVEDAAKYLAKLSREYAEGWKHRVMNFRKTAEGFGRMVESRQQRDMIPALYDAADTAAGYFAAQMKNRVKLTSETPLDRQAATFVQQAKGDKAGMIAKLNSLRGTAGGKYDKIIDHAIKDWDRLIPIADAARKATDGAYQAAQAGGIDLQYREGYVKGSYEEYDMHNGKVVFDDTKGGGGTSSSFKKPKIFNDYTESIKAGFTPKTLDLADLTQSSVLNTMRKVNRLQWAESIGAMKMPDGKDVIVPPKIITGPSSSGRIVNRGFQAPPGYRLAEVQPGSMVAVHEDAYPIVSKLLDPSHFPRVMMQLAAGVKHNILAFDIYHGSRFSQMQMAMMRQATPSFRKGLSVLEYADSDLTEAVRKGEVTAKDAAWARTKRPIIEAGITNGLNVGKISDALYRDIAPLIPGAKETSHFIFEKLSRGVIAESYVYAYERNARLYPKMSPEKLARYTAKEINTYYRNLGNQGLLKSKTFQDAARFFGFAPQWFEGRLRSEMRGYAQLGAAPFKGRVGNVGAAMGTGLIAYLAVAQIVNMLTRGKPTWQNPEAGHKWDAWIPDKVEGSNGLFLNPFSVFAETTHDVMKLSDRGMDPQNIPGEILRGQVGPVPRSAWDVMTGHDFYGRKLDGLDRWLQAGKDLAPVPLMVKGAGIRGDEERRGLSFAGIKTVQAGSFTSQAFSLANEWMRKNDIKKPGEEGEEGPPSVYRPLINALMDGDKKRIQQEYDDLRKTTKQELIDRHFAMLPKVHFTGRIKTEADWKKSMTPQQRDIYDKAMAERKKLAADYRAMRREEGGTSHGPTRRATRR